jgi:hypothetical protein
MTQSQTYSLTHRNRAISIELDDLIPGHVNGIDKRVTYTIERRGSVI